jgi:hypothetical protein
MSLVIDVTLGLVLTYYLVLISNHVLSKAYTSRMKSGNYFKGVKKGTRVFYVIDYAAWTKQIFIWLSLVMLVAASDAGEGAGRGSPARPEGADRLGGRPADEDVGAAQADSAPTRTSSWSS